MRAILLLFDSLNRRALESYGGAAELAKAEADERFVIPEGAHWNDVRQLPKDIGRALQTTMRAIEAAKTETERLFSEEKKRLTARISELEADVQAKSNALITAVNDAQSEGDVKVSQNTRIN